MRLDILLFCIIIAGFLYIGGYKTIALWVIGLGVLGFIVGSLAEKKKEEKAEKIEPIVIESTRGAPYKIPSEMTIFVAKKKQALPWGSPFRTGIPGAVHRGISKLIGKKKEEK